MGSIVDSVEDKGVLRERAHYLACWEMESCSEIQVPGFGGHVCLRSTEDILQQLAVTLEENQKLRNEVKRLSDLLQLHAVQIDEASEAEVLNSNSDDDSHDCHWRRVAKALELQLKGTAKHDLNGVGNGLASDNELSQTIQKIESFLYMVLKGFPFCVTYCDNNLRYTYVKCHNNGTSECKSEEFIGKKDAELVDILPEALQLMQLKNSVFHTGASQRREVKVEKGAKTSSLVVVCEPFYRKGRIEGVITISIDITSQVSMEDKLARMKIETAEWERTEQDLRQAIKFADEAIEAKNSFLAVMSHEIRTPLNGVLGMAQVLATTPLDAEQKELVDAMVFSGDVLLAIISDILDLSKVESGTMKLEEKEFNPRDIVKHVVRTAIAATKGRGVKIEADISEEVPAMVIGDPLRLKQVITNLVFNAVKFTKKGRVLVRLRVVTGDSQAAKTDLETNGDASRERPAATMVTCLDGGNGRSIDLGDKWDVLLEGGRRDIENFTVPEDVEDEGNKQTKTQMVDSEVTGDANRARYLLKIQRPLEMIPEDVASEDECRRRITPPLQELGDLQLDQDPRLVEPEGMPEHKVIWLQFAVEDTGIGIPEEAFPSLFEKFTQVHSSTTRKYGGTGLGLAICKQLVELMGGRISVSSRVGEGSTFSFTLCCKCNGPGQKELTRFISQRKLKKNLSYTTAHIHKLQAGLSCTSPPGQGIAATTSCPLPDRHGHAAAKKKEYSPSNGTQEAPLPGEQARPVETKRSGLRRTCSGPPRIECSLMAAVEDSKEIQVLSNATAGGRRRPKLLLAEDNKVNVMVAVSMLKRLGLSTDVAFNGQEAVKAIQAKQYDLVLMDVCMPVLDGLEVTRRVRLFEKTGTWDEDSKHSESSELKHQSDENEIPVTKRRRLPIVAMTANALSDCEEQCVEYGMDSFVTKPITFKKMKDVLELFLGHKKRLETVTEKLNWGKKPENLAQTEV